MTKRTLSIHSENILPIIKKWLYSERDIFLRELVSNSQDAIVKLKTLVANGKAYLEENPDFRIDITLDTEAKTLTIADNGIGMTADEVEKYICQVAFSGAEEFVQHYKTGGDESQIIGHFGLGFYSAFMVSSKVELLTLSHEMGSQAVQWSSDGSIEYELQPAGKEGRGTTVTLHVNDEEFLDPEHITAVLNKYCRYLPYAITFNGSRVNPTLPLWTKRSHDTTDEEVRAFYHELYPAHPDPILWVQLNIDHPFHLQGILYFPKIHSHFDFQKQELKLFSNRVFVTDRVKDLFPDFLTMMEGAIDSPDIPLNVSRSFLQMDKTVRQLGKHIIKKVCDKLSSLHNLERDRFISIWNDLEMVVKLGLLSDDTFFERSREFFLFKTLEGTYVNLSDFKEKETVYYTGDDTTSHLAALYKKAHPTIIVARSPLDMAVLSRLENKLSLNFSRIDSALHDALLDPSKEKTLLSQDGKNEAQLIADFVKSALQEDDLAVEAKSLSADSIPAFLQLDEGARRLRDYFRAQENEGGPSLPLKKTLILNTSHPLVDKLLTLKSKDRPLSEKLARHIYHLSLFTQKEMDKSRLQPFLDEWNDLLLNLSTYI